MRHVLVISECAGGDAEWLAGLATADWAFRAFDDCPWGTLPRHHADLLVLVGVPEPTRALALLRQFEQERPRGRILAAMPRGLDDDALALVSSVADDFVLLPESAEVVRHRIRRFLLPGEEAERAYGNLVAALGKANLVGRDPAFLRLAEKLVPCADNDFPALITGETGTGKDLFARAMHFLGRRRGQPFIPVDCAGIPDHLFENELFGHARGAYTDAHGEQRGLAALADKGTLFLDEIDSLSLPAQAKLLRFLQDHRFKPLGSERYVHSDVRIVAATNRNLERHVEEKHFRSDLYFRLHVLRLDLPPLRERPRDIALLAEHFLAQYLPAGTRKCFSPGAMQRLNTYHWPGNVRELANIVQRAIVFSQGPHIDGCDIALPEAAGAAPPAGTFRAERKEVLRNFEREYVEDLLRRNQGNVTWAAREAGKERRAFGRLVKKYAAQPPRAPGR